MKRTLLTLLLIGVLMTACSSDNEWNDSSKESDLSQSQDNASESPKYYMRINLQAPPVMSGRATGNLWDYEDGSAEENEVNSVRFYFFDSYGKIVKIKEGESGSSDYSYCYDHDIDDTRASGVSRAGNNVAKSVTVNFGLIFETNKLPSHLIAIVNPPLSLKSIDIASLDEIEVVAGDFYTGLTTSNFVMSNSVYVKESDGSKEVMKSVPLTKENFALAGATPQTVDVYVERVVARLDLAFGMAPAAGKENTFALGINYSPADDADVNKQVYVKMTGWAVTSTPTESHLLKSVGKDWTDAEFKLTDTSWNYPDDFRSFWAINPANVSYNRYSYADITGETIAGSQRNPECHPISVRKSYMQENANPATGGSVKPANAGDPTKVIFGAQLVDENDIPLTIAEYESKYYTLEGLKDLIADNLDLYTESNAEGTLIAGEKKYRKIGRDDLDFETSFEHGNELGPDADGTYYVYFILKAEDNSAPKKIWYHKADVLETLDESKGMLAGEVNRYIDEMTFPAKVWKEGYTYYYFDIPHFNRPGDDPGTYGVVRNNIYNATVTSIRSLGTPVYNPDEIIYPEHPASSGNQLEVEVNTVQWRLVNQNLQLAW